MKKIYSVIFVICACIFTTNAQMKTLRPYKVYKQITIDGVISASEPWAAADWVEVNNSKPSSAMYYMSANFQLLFDDTNLYIAVKVNDATRNIGNSVSYTNDCVEVYLDIDTTTADTKYKAGTWQIRKQAGPDGLVDGAGGSMSNFQIASSDDGSAYLQEWSLPWDSLTVGMDDPMIWKTNFCIKFDIKVSDATSEGFVNQQMFWNDNSDLQWNNTSKFGLLRLSATACRKSTNCGGPWGAVNNLKASDFNIFPVPASNKLFIESSETITTVEVFTITGHKLLVVNDKELNISNLKPGSYLARINTASGSVVKGFVKR